jgi:hypothetical protein
MLIVASSNLDHIEQDSRKRHIVQGVDRMDGVEPCCKGKSDSVVVTYVGVK